MAGRSTGPPLAELLLQRHRWNIVLGVVSQTFFRVLFAGAIIFGILERQNYHYDPWAQHFDELLLVILLPTALSLFWVVEELRRRAEQRRLEGTLIELDPDHRKLFQDFLSGDEASRLGKTENARWGTVMYGTHLVEPIAWGLLAIVVNLRMLFGAS